MKIAVIGAGFFGTALALTISKFYKVSLYEISNEILNGASRANQFRYHLGYHYPRSQNYQRNFKCRQIQFANNHFYNFSKKTLNFYGISNSDSKISFNKYLKILRKKKLNLKNIIKLLNIAQ